MQLEKLVFQVVVEKEASQHTEIAWHHKERMTKETSFPSRIGKKDDRGQKKNLWKIAGIANSSLIQETQNTVSRRETTKTSHTGCDSPTWEITGERPKHSHHLEHIATEKTSRTGRTSRQNKKVVTIGTKNCSKFCFRR